MHGDLLIALGVTLERMRFNRSLRTVIAAGLAMSLLASCAGDDPEPSPPPPPAPSPTSAEPVYAPLTGIEVPEAIEHPALSAKIDNNPLARPQIALEQADVVVEELVEGGTTRYAATWHSQIPAEIGPVRSVRPMDPAIIGPYGGVIAYSGGHYIEQMQATGVENVVHDSGQYDDVFYRATDRIAPHNLFLNSEEIVQRFSELDAPEELWTFAEETDGATSQSDGAEASRIELVYSQGEGRSWDCADDSWSRSQNGQLDLDMNGDPYGATNVIALSVQIQYLPGDVPETLLVGYGGDGFVASGCSSVPVTWTQESVNDPIVLTTDDGEEIELAPGNTWIHLVPVSGSTSIS